MIFLWKTDGDLRTDKICSSYSYKSLFLFVQVQKKFPVIIEVLQNNLFKGNSHNNNLQEYFLFWLSSNVGFNKRLTTKTLNVTQTVLCLNG